MEVLRDYGRFVGLKGPARPLDRVEERIIASEQGWPPEGPEYDAALREYTRKSGAVPFSLMLPLAHKLLESSQTLRREVSARHRFIVLDECQDTKEEQWAFLRLMGEESRVLALGDPNQMIYESQREAALARLAAFEKWKGIERTGLDGPNFRCKVSGIVQFAEALLEGRNMDVAALDGVQLFPAYVNQRRATLAALWAEIRRLGGEGASVAFIVPSARVARDFAASLREPALGSAMAIPIYARVESDEGLSEAFRLAVCAAADYVTVRSDANRRALAISLGVFADEWSRRNLTPALVDKIEKRLGSRSRAASPLREFLRDADVHNLPTFGAGLADALAADSEFSTAGTALLRNGLPELGSLAGRQGELFRSYREARGAAGLEGHSMAPGRTTLLSMHRSKGREYDFVVLVVDPRQHSSSSTLNELRRLYYVSATRARQWLGVTYVPGRAGPVLGPVLGL